MLQVCLGQDFAKFPRSESSSRGHDLLHLGNAAAERPGTVLHSLLSRRHGAVAEDVISI